MATIDEHPLQSTKVLKKTISSLFIWGIVFLVILIPAHLFLWETLPTLLLVADGLAILILLIQPLYQYLYYKDYFYDVRKDFLVIKKGVLTPRETILNYTKLQDVYVDQDLLDRLFGLYDVHVSTATALSGASAHIDGVNHDNAQAIRELILSKIRKKK